MGRNVIADLTKKNAANAPSRAKWEPKYPEFSLVPEAMVPERIDEETTGWQSAPADSHVHSFKKIFAMTPLGREMNGGHQIRVRFKPTNTAPMTEYVYKWQNIAEANAVWEMLVSAEHPGEVIHREMIKKAVPYQRVSQGS